MDLDQLLDKVKDKARQMNEPRLDQLAAEVKGYLDVGKLMSRTVDFEKPATVRKTQQALAEMEARLDRVVAIHHDAKRSLQIISSVEYQLIGALTRAGSLSAKATGPAQQQALMTAAPLLIKVKTRWESLDIVCTMAQKRIASARESIKLQSSLDDNLRWAQFRSPG